MEKLGSWTYVEILDSDALIGILRNSPGAVELTDRIDKTGKGSTTSINIYEILMGAKRMKREDKILEARNLLGKLDILYFDGKAAEKASSIHAEISLKGEQLDIRDIFIGSIAMANGCSVTTRNVKHFSKIKGLTVKKW